MSYVIYVNDDGKDCWFNECGTEDTEARATAFATRKQAEVIRSMCGLYKWNAKCKTEVRASKIPVTFGVVGPKIKLKED